MLEFTTQQHNNTTTQQHNNTTTQQHNNTTTQQHNNTTTRAASPRLKYSPCVLSSLLFCVNIIVALYYNYVLYAALFTLLLCTSLIVHYLDNLQNKELFISENTVCILNIIDRLVVYSVVIYGGHIYLQKMNNNKQNYLIPITFLVVLCMYLLLWLVN